MNFAVFADLHIDKYAEFSSINKKGINSRLADQLRFLRTLRSYCVKNHISTVIFLGDLIHGHAKIDVEVYNYVYREFLLFKEAHVNVWMIPGNHDLILKSKPEISTVYPLSRVAKIIAKPCVINHAGVDFCFIPWTEEPEIVRAAITSFLSKPRPRKGRRYLFAHLCLKEADDGFSMRHSTTITARMLHPGKWDYIFLGHIHKRQKIRRNCLYVGAPLPISWNEKGQRRMGFEIVRSSTIATTTKLIEFSAPRFLRLTTKILLESPEVIKKNFIELIVPHGETKKWRKLLVRAKPRAFRIIEEEDDYEDVETKLDIKMEMDEMLGLYIEDLDWKLNNKRLLRMALDIAKEVEEARN